MSNTRLIASAVAVLLSGVAAPVWIAPVKAQAAPVQTGSFTMQEAITVAVNSNPEVAQAQYNKEAIQFERKQAQGLYAPRVDVEASAGWRHLENTTRRNLGIAGQELYPVSAEARGEWVAFDFGRRRGELLRQAARVDGASLRVVERSEYIALQVARQYLDVLLQQRVLAASEDNVAFHQALAGDLASGVQQGSISIADQQQAEERLQAALVRQSEAEQSLTEAKITLRRLTGLDVNDVTMPPSLAQGMPASLSEALGFARTDNPLVKEALADVDAANSLADSVRGDGYPKVGVAVAGRVGEDIDGFRGSTNDVEAKAFLRWNVFDGGITRANYQEMVRRASEARYRLYAITREAEEDVQTAWTTMQSQGRISGQLQDQSRVSDDLLLSYRSQFNVGRRSLLDVLDAQNTRYSVQVRLETARFSEMFARYQTLAATNRFLETMNIAPGAGAGENERERFDYGPPRPAETQYRTYPK